MKRRFNKSFIAILFLMLTLCITNNVEAASVKTQFGMAADASEIQEADYDSGPYESAYGSLRDWNWAKSGHLHYVINSENNIEVVMYNSVNHVLNIYEYTADYQYIDKKTVSLPLEKWGDFYEGIDGNYYIAVGQDNLEENDEAIVLTIIKYSRQWEELGSVDFKGSISNEFWGVYEIFSCGESGFAMVEDKLFYYFSREMYADGEGVHHESDITVAVDTATMTDITSLVKFPYNSHSFNQYIKTDGTKVYYLSHGDAYPRALNVTMYNKYNFKGGFTSAAEQEVFSFMGATGANYTGATVTGFELGTEKHLIIGSSVPHNNAVADVTGYDSALAKNIYLILLGSDNTSYTFKWLTNYNPSVSDVSLGTPTLLKVADNRFVVMFDEYKNSIHTLRYMLLNEEGDVLCERYYDNIYYRASSKPMLIDDQIVWLSNQTGKNCFMTIPYLEENDDTVLIQNYASEMFVTLGGEEGFVISYGPESDAINMTSSNEAVIAIENGQMKTTGCGQSVVTIKSGDISIEMTINVIGVEQELVLIEKGKQEAVQIINVQDDWAASYQTSDNTIANVDEDGTITALAPGETDITVRVASVSINVHVICYEIEKNAYYFDEVNGDIYQKNYENSAGTKKWYIIGDYLYVIYDGSSNTGILNQGDTYLSFKNTSSGNIVGERYNYTNRMIVVRQDISELKENATCVLMCLKERSSNSSSYISIDYNYLYFINNELYLSYSMNIGSEEITIDDIPAQNYVEGETINPEVNITFAGKKLEESRDYSVSYSNDIVGGIGKVTIRGRGSFSGTIVKEYTIIKPEYDLNFDQSQLTLAVGDYEYLSILEVPSYVTGSAQWSSSDETVVQVYSTYSRMVRIKACGNGEAVILANLDGKTAYCRVIVEAPYVEPDVEDETGTEGDNSNDKRGTGGDSNITDGNDNSGNQGVDSEQNDDSTSDNNTSGNTTSDNNVSENGNVANKKNISKLTIKGVPKTKIYTGKAIKPKVKVYDGDNSIVASHYKVIYGTNKKTGKATIKITANSSSKLYYGSVTKTFYIVPKSVSVKSVKSTAKGKILVKFKKVNGATKYQIAYRQNGTKKYKTVTVSAKNSSKTIKGLRRKKYYEVKIRAYKSVDGKKYYGQYGKTKRVKVK